MILFVNSQVSVTAEIFNYEPPNITSVSNGRTEGDYITITGAASTAQNLSEQCLNIQILLLIRFWLLWLMRYFVP